MSADETKQNDPLKDVSTVAKPESAKAPKQKVTSEEFFNEKAEEAKTSGEDQLIDLTTKVKVEFLEDIGFMKKGDKQEISQSAFDTYNMGDSKIVKELR